MQQPVETNLDGLIASLPDLTPHGKLLIERAYRFAEAAHAGQTRKSGEPYFTHCVAVAQILADLQLDAEAIASALLHDVVEDCEVTVDELRSAYGKDVASIVEHVSKIKQLVDNKPKSKTEMELEYFRKMLMTIGEDVRVVLVKLADRLHNMRTLAHMPEQKQKNTAQETLDIFVPLANRLGIWQMKWELEDLSFRYLDPVQYKTIAKGLDERRSDREMYMTRVIQTLREALAQEGLPNVNISGRPKHIYSIYKKMQRKEVGIQQIYDVRAMRVIVDTVMQCYQVLGIVHGLWRPVPGEFDDYIAVPKDNFYRSLHTAVMDNHGKHVEVQIRTWEMHEDAEYGIAAHWRYKEGDSKIKHDKSFQQRLADLRRWMEFGPQTSDARSFLDAIKSDLFQDRVYVFTPKGDIYDLPAGATPVDFAYHIHTEIGHCCRGAKIDGRLVGLNYQLKNGEQVEIVTAKRGRPSLDWLNKELGYVNTERARGKIRAWFRKQDRANNITAGREVLERELKRFTLEHVSFDVIAGLFGFQQIDDFLAEIGTGGVSGTEIAKRTLEEEGRNQAPKLPATTKEAVAQLQLTSPSRVKAKNEIGVAELDGVLVNLAKCCNPLHGDDIAGYITRGRGITVHRKDCSNLSAIRTSEPQRLQELSWGEEKPEQRFLVPLEIMAYDREGLLRDITTVISDTGSNMTRVMVSTRKSMATLEVTLEIADFQQLTRIVNQVEHITNVVEVRRKRGA